MRSALVLLAATLILFAGCGSSPSYPDMQGTWTGGIATTSRGTGTATVAVTSQSQGQFSGTFQWLFTSPPASVSGSTQGSIQTDGTVDLTNTDQSQCVYQTFGNSHEYQPPDLFGFMRNSCDSSDLLDLDVKR